MVKDRGDAVLEVAAAAGLFRTSEDVDADGLLSNESSNEAVGAEIATAFNIDRLLLLLVLLVLLLEKP